MEIEIYELTAERLRVAEELGISVAHRAVAIRELHEQGEMEAAIEQLAAIDAAINEARQARVLPVRSQITPNQDMLDIVQRLIDRINESRADDDAGQGEIEDLAEFLLRRFTIHEICDVWHLNDDERYVFTADGLNVSSRPPPKT